MNSHNRLIIAVDGPAGSGKGSVCRAVAQRFGMAYLDTGLVYRALALHAIRHGVDDWQQLVGYAATLPLNFVQSAAWLDGEEVTLALRDEAVGQRASLLSAVPSIRAALLDFQRGYGGDRDAIFDGRDVATVLFPEACLKLFITADLAVRAQRRALELQLRGEDVSLDDVRFRMSERDARDAARSHAPLTVAPDAVVIDTTHLTLEQTMTRVMGEVERIWLAAGRRLPLT
ncbi:MAG: (d)CMP kinase [Magnetococcales bacterium]|nr:(d)CMP kinase [Magnetococcales bacterium]